MSAKTNKRGINLGKVWNKYLIIDIFFSAGEKDPQREAEIVLWLCSCRHRIFLPKNFAWYPKNVTPPVWWWLKSQSGQLETSQQGQFLFEHIRIDGEREVTKVTRIFTASRDSWNAEAFYLRCNGKGPTLCLIRSSHNYLAAGFTSIAWKSTDGTNVEDASACVFALTDKMQVFKPKNPKEAVRHNSMWGPYWYNALKLYGDMQNGWSFTKGHEYDYGKYEVARLPDGKNPLVGSTDEFDRFTCVELEVFAL